MSDRWSAFSDEQLVVLHVALDLAEDRYADRAKLLRSNGHAADAAQNEARLDVARELGEAVDAAILARGGWPGDAE